MAPSRPATGPAASTSATSVEVPPMSKVMIGKQPARAATACAPTTPPAGPERIVRTGSRAAVAAPMMPPEDCMTASRSPRARAASRSSSRPR